MKFFYIANIRLPTERAHGIQIMEMCGAFAEQGCSVELVVPNRRNHLHEDPFIYHDVPRTFSIKRLPCIDTVDSGKAGYLLELLSFMISVTAYSLFQKNALFYSRDEVIAIPLRLLMKKVAWEGHAGQTNVAVRALILLKTPMIVITKSIKDLYLSMGVVPENIIVAPDAADIDRFDIAIGKEEARKQLGLPLGKKIILYKGHLYAEKGAGVLALAMPYVKDKNAIAVFIGGTEEDIDSFRKEFSEKENIFILGNRPRKETPFYQKAADVLIIPNSAKDDMSRLYTSPMKLFGYMASGVPIVASDLPSLKEVLDENNAYLVSADSPEALAKGIDIALANESESSAKAEKAYERAQEFTWKSRANIILAFIKNTTV